jgi:hypothetical protein
MMFDPLTLWLGAKAAEFVFKPVLDDLAKDLGKDAAKDFCKSAFKSVFSGKDEWAKAAGKALTKFLLQFEQELIGAGETEETVKTYIASLRSFAKIPNVREVIGSVLTDPTISVDTTLLAETWKQNNFERLPDDFSWNKLCRRYQKDARDILNESAELREIINAIQICTTTDAVERIAGLAPGFNTSNYAQGLRRRYGHLKLESFDPTPDHQRIALTKIFVEQFVRSCQHFNPRIYELPVEHRRKLRERALKLEAELGDEELKRQRDAYLQQSSRSVLNTIQDPRNRLCVILGDPGSGKSVLLEYLSLLWAERPEAERACQTIPLLIELKTYVENIDKGNCITFLDYLDHGSGIVCQLDHRELDALLIRGQAILLLDGLDEIFDQATRQRVTQDIVALSTRYSSARFIVTSRTIGYDLVAPLLRNAEFQHFLLQDLDESQQDQFIRVVEHDARAGPRRRHLRRSGRRPGAR